MSSISQHSDTIILGGGLSGLTLAQYLDNPVVLEADAIPGGLCRTFEKDGFRYDIGGHILFSRQEALLNEMLGWLDDNMLQRRRRNVIWYKDRFVKYPFENGLAALEKDEILEILLTFLERKEFIPTNLEEWCYSRFGSGLADKYLLPYNRKIWKRDTKQMSVHWVERIPSPPTEDLLKSAIGIETEGYQHQLYFYYPKEGGIEGLIHGLARRTPGLRTGFRVTSVKRLADRWEVSNGEETYTCRTLVNTMPIFDLMRCLEGVPAEVNESIAQLQYNGMLVVMVGVKHEGLNTASAVYVPSPETLAHRVCFMSYFSSSNAPAGCSNLAAEITLPPGDPLYTTDDSTIIERVIRETREMCHYSPDDVVTAEVKHIPYAYPVYDLDYLKNSGIFRDYLTSLGIYSTGRFATFSYINMDQCVEMAQQTAAAIRRDAIE